MKRINLGKKKSLIILISVVVLAGAGAGYWFVLKPKMGDAKVAATPAPTPSKVADIDAAMKANTKISTFYAVTANVAVKADEKGNKPMLMIFAPSNEAFKTTEMKPFDALDAAAKEEIKKYHYVPMNMTADGKAPSMTLTDGEKLTTLAGRDLIVKKKDSQFYLVDTKGREAKINSGYVDDKAGNRLYYIDSVMLIQ